MLVQAAQNLKKADNKVTEDNQGRRPPRDNAEAQKKHQQGQEAVDKMIRENEAKYQSDFKGL